MSVTLLVGDCVEVLRTFETDSIDAVVTDPPYGIGFMGKEWDTFKPEAAEARIVGNADVESENPNLRGRTRSPASSPSAIEYDYSTEGLVAFQQWTCAWGKEAFRVLKPGAHAIVCGAPRAYHRMACGLEDAGFEIRDCLAWIFGQGFPKNLNVGRSIDTMLCKLDGRHCWNEPRDKSTPWHICPRTMEGMARDGLGTALKPAHEPIVLARKPLSASVAATVHEHGTGALNIDACRIDGVARTQFGHAPVAQAAVLPTSRDGTTDEGRWPSNVMIDEMAAAIIDQQSGETTSTGGRIGNAGGGAVLNVPTGRFSAGNPGFGDVGGASRFFYCPKPSRDERDAGLENFEARTTTETVERHPDSAGVQNPRAGAGRGAGAPIYGCARCGLNLQGGRAARPCTNGSEHERIIIGYGERVRNFHPTVKPVALMRWLVRLVTPVNGDCLDPFMGSGTTGIACKLEQRRFIGIEQRQDYVAIAQARIAAILPLFERSSDVIQPTTSPPLAMEQPALDWHHDND